MEESQKILGKLLSICFASNTARTDTIGRERYYKCLQPSEEEITIHKAVENELEGVDVYYQASVRAV